MEWVIIIGVMFVVLVVFAVKAENKKNAVKLEQSNAYSTEVESAKQTLLTSSSSASLPVLKASDVGYCPVAALLHKSGDRRTSPFPGQTYPMA